MSAWIVSIVGVICLGVLLEIVLPEGQTAKYVKGAFSLLVVFVIASPLPALIKGNFKFDMGGADFSVDESFAADMVGTYSDYTEKEIERFLEDNGYETKVTISVTESSPKKVSAVDITVMNFKAELEGEVAEEVKRLVCERYRCKPEVITVRLLSV